MRMNKFIHSTLTALAVAAAVLLNGCDIFENFMFNVPLSYKFQSSGIINLVDSGSANLEDSETYNNVKDKVNTITFVEGYIAVLDVNPQDIHGNLKLNLFGGASASGQHLASYEVNDIIPYELIASPLKIELEESEMQNINNYLANKENPRTFFGVFEITDLNLLVTSSIEVRIDLLFLVDADL
jgi:hypothetical protein